MHRVAVALLLLGLALGLAMAGHAAPGPKPTFEISAVHAKFVPAKRETIYFVERHHFGNPRPVHVTWSLKLELVDPAGAPDPGTPGSGAGVDLGCTNAGVGVAKPEKETAAVSVPTPEFIWHHPDPPDSFPAGKYHCDHGDMGPHGHQGLIKVIVSDGRWSCTASYKGTNSSTALSEKDGTASKPKCTRVS